MTGQGWSKGLWGALLEGGGEGRWAGAVRFANAHLIDDETVAKMGHPGWCRTSHYLSGIYPFISGIYLL